MKPFPPHKIHHIYLNNTLVVPALDVKEKGNYLVFWWKNVGLGQFFIEPNKPLTQDEYFEKLITVIKPTIAFYLKEDIANNEWEYWLAHQMFEDWFAWMEAIFSKFTALKIPATVPVSVVICTRNRASHLQRCLTALQELNCRPEEIVVVDNAPVDDSTKNVTENFAGVKYVVEARPGLDFARNTGILNSALPIIAFTDDDVRVDPFWVYNVWETFQNPTVGAMTGLIIALSLDTEAQFVFEKYWSFNRGYTDKIYDDIFFRATLPGGPPVWEIGAGANMAFRKSVFEKTGFFDELLDVGAAGCNGDSEMWFRILFKGFTIHYNPRAITYHEHRKDIKGLKKQIFYYMRGFTTAALIQQKLCPEAGYIKYKLKKFPLYYRQLIVKDFPNFNLRLRTLSVEVRGILSGLKYYNKHKNRLP